MLAILILIPGLFSCFRNQPLAPKKVLLHDNWTFEKAGSDSTFKAQVPGCVHLDLMRNGLIEDPYLEENEKTVQWVENEDWIYRTTFRANDIIMAYSHVDLVFEGLDTYAEVYLNDSLILKAENMFREWRIDVKGLLKNGHNDLKVVFQSPVRMNREKSSQLPFQLPDERAFSRKAPYMFGWDWGPRLVTSGMWKPVYLETWDQLKIGHWQVLTDSLGEDRANVRIIVNVQANDTLQAHCRYKVSVNGWDTIPVNLEKGENKITIPVTLEDPELWWTHNLGEPFMYDFIVSIIQNDESVDFIRGRFGLRTIELVHEPDKDGKSFYFKLNGVPVFMKGANYIPQDNFPSRVGREQYYEIIRNARLANMNMLRIWGGGIYGDDDLYRFCDESGILVWQDFMFACTMYPGDSAFIENVKEEARQQVLRLRNHPSLALWCGNNEVDEGWHNWGWQKQFGYSEEDSARIWTDYLKLFHQLLPEIVREYDGRNAYWPSSPKHGWGRKESLTDGDMHYWGVWWGREPFEKYEEKVGRFMSEYGFQGYPPYNIILETIPENERKVGSTTLLSHQKHPFGEEVILQFMEKYYPVPRPENLEDYVYLSQLLQAYGMKIAIEAHRRAMPRCMGTLYWQLNDCWPAISWSGLDHQGRWKALHYFARRAFENVMISASENNGDLSVFLVNDHLEDKPGKLHLALSDFKGNILEEDSVKIDLPGNSSLECYHKPLDNILKGHGPDKVILRMNLMSEGDTIASANWYFSAPKELSLVNPEIDLQVVENKKNVTVYLYSDDLVKDLFLDFKGFEGRFSDNFFDLVPGEKKEIIFYPENTDDLPEEKDLLVKHLNGILLNQN